MDNRSVLEQETLVEPPIKKRRIEAGSRLGFNSIDHNPTAPGEAMPVYFPRGLPEMVLSYLGGDINPKPKKKCLKHSYQPVTLFCRNFQELMHPEAALVAKLILHGEEKDVEKALVIIKMNPDLLRYHTIATDPLGRRVKGTPLQIAAMAGDVDLRKGIEEEKDHGMVERLIAAGNLSKEEVTEQLQVMTSKKAQQENTKRNQRVLAAIVKFGKCIRETKADKNMSLKAFQQRCKKLIQHLEIDLQSGKNELITSGYIFDIDILKKTRQWFEKNFKSFGGALTNQSNVFLINGFGKLQNKLSSRDAQLVTAGIDNWVNDDTCPPRTIINPAGVCYFYHSSSRLGVDFYVGYYGARNYELSQLIMETRFFEKLVTVKNESIAKIYTMPRPSVAI